MGRPSVSTARVGAVGCCVPFFGALQLFALTLGAGLRCGFGVALDDLEAVGFVGGDLVVGEFGEAFLAFGFAFEGFFDVGG